MSIPLDVAIYALVLCSGFALIVGVCIRTPPEPAPDDFKAVALHALAQLEADEAPRRIEMDPYVRSRLYHQESARRYRLRQLAEARPQTNIAA